MSEINEDDLTRTLVYRHENSNMKKTLLVLNCLMLVIGMSCGPLIMNLYYLNGGQSIWLSSGLITGGWPIMIIPLFGSYLRRCAIDCSSKIIFVRPVTALHAALIGLVSGVSNYCYAYGVKHIPVSTSSLIVSTQLAFTAGFAFILVGQKFTAYSVNSVALLTFGAVVLGLHANSDKPAGETSLQYYLGFFFTLVSSALAAAMTPLIELSFKKSKQVVTYSVVMEFQLVLCFSATVACTVGLLISGDYKTYGEEQEVHKLGNGLLIIVVICSTIIWQCYFVGAFGVIYYGSSLLSGIITVVALSITEIMSIIFYNEMFQVDKGVSFTLSLWGLLSYFYGEALENKESDRNDITSFNHM